MWPSEQLLEAKAKLIENGYRECEADIEQFRAGKLEAQTGSTPEETLETRLNKVLSQIREDAGRQCLDELPRSNAPLIMARCGSKGSNINMSQMIACVGQQTISGKRIPNGFEGR